MKIKSLYKFLNVYNNIIIRSFIEISSKSSDIKKKKQKKKSYSYDAYNEWNRVIIILKKK